MDKKISIRLTEVQYNYLKKCYIKIGKGIKTIINKEISEVLK